MKAHILRGSKQEIAEWLIRINGQIREAIVFEEESASQAAQNHFEVEDVFVEMDPFMVEAQNVDDSRESAYVRMEGE